jgi:hypothetical protein
MASLTSTSNAFRTVFFHPNVKGVLDLRVGERRPIYLNAEAFDSSFKV